MKKLFLVLGIIGLTQTVFAQTLPPELEVKTGQIAPTQKLHPNNKAEALRIFLTAKNHPSGSIGLMGLKLKHEGADKSQFTEYALIKGDKVLARVKNSPTEDVEFSNLDVTMLDGKSVELKVMATIGGGDIYGVHYFSITDTTGLFLKPKGSDGYTTVTGNFPIRSNKIMIAENFDMTTLTKDCNLREEPVCGEDGMTYYNVCLPFQKGVDVLHRGQCEGNDTLPVCSYQKAPVCGEDAKTYDNECLMQRAKTKKKYDGECFPATFSKPVLFGEAVKLFDIKKNELQKMRPSLSESTKKRLNEISAVLHTYNFLEKEYNELVTKLNDFLNFTQNQSSRDALNKEIEIFNSAIMSARIASAKEKFEKGTIPFLDTDEEAWFFGPVKFLKARDLIKDFYDQNNFVNNEDQSQNIFRPDAFVTKAQFTKLMLDITEQNYSQSIISQSPFAKTHWAKNVIAFAESKGLTMWRNYPNPDKRVSRSDAIQLIMEVIGMKNLPDGPSIPSFTDVPRSANYFRAVEYAKKIGLISGYEDKTFRPKNDVRRAEAAKLAVKAYDMFNQNK